MGGGEGRSGEGGQRRRRGGAADAGAGLPAPAGPTRPSGIEAFDGTCVLKPLKPSRESVRGSENQVHRGPGRGPGAPRAARARRLVKGRRRPRRTQEATVNSARQTANSVRQAVSSVRALGVWRRLRTRRDTADAGRRRSRRPGSTNRAARLRSDGDVTLIAALIVVMTMVTVKTMAWL